MPEEHTFFRWKALSSKKYRNFTVYLIVSIFVFSVAVPTVNANQENWTEDIRLTYSNGRSVAPAIAVEGKNVHVVYADNETRDEFHMLPWYVRSSDGGNTWSIPICLNNSYETDIEGIRIAVNGNYIHMIWFDHSDGKVHYLKSTDNGNSWDSERSISSKVKDGTFNWDLGIYKNNLHVIYLNPDRKLLYTNSNDNGITWSSPKILMPSVCSGIHSVLSVEGSNIHVTVDANIVIMGIPTVNIFYTRSIDNGVNWDSEVNINEVTGIDALSTTPDIAASGNNIHVIFRGDSNRTGRVYYAYSNDNGIHWKNGGMLSNNTRSYVAFPIINAGVSTIFTIWCDRELYYKYSNDGGVTWSSNSLLTVNKSYNILPDINGESNTFHFVWVSDRDGNWEIYYKRCSLYEAPINATINIDPDTLNLKSKGKWITAYIELEKEYNLNKINISTIKIEDTIYAEPRPTKIGDYDKDGIPDLMVKFDRTELEDILTVGDSILLSIKGNFFNGKVFEGKDIIRVIEPP